MIVLLSPTKQMDFSNPIPASLEEFLSKRGGTEPPFLNEASEINKLLVKLDPEALAALMKTSEKLTEQTVGDIRRFASPSTPVRPAILAYSGTVFQSLDGGALTEDQLNFAQEHLLILSGLYGALHPLDEIRPYRLEMKTVLNLPGGETLASFWKSRVSELIKRQLASDPGSPALLNLSSGEYSRVLDKTAFKSQLLNFHFKEDSGGKLRTVGMYAKTARGLMARRILIEKTDNPETLKKGHTGGYRFDGKISSGNDWFFVR